MDSNTVPIEQAVKAYIDNNIPQKYRLTNTVWKAIKKAVEKNCQHCSYDIKSGVLTIIPQPSIEHIDLKIIIKDDVLEDCHLEDSLFEI